MQQYINTETNQLATEAEIRSIYSNTSFGVPFVPPEVYAVVFPAPQPAYDSLTQTVVPDVPKLTVKGTWEQQWKIVELEPEVIAANQAAKASQRWEAIKAIRDTKVQSGGYKAINKWFHSDTFSRTQQMGLVMLGASLPAGMQWKTMDGSFITMTPALAAAVFQAAASQDSLLFKHAEVLKADSSLDINQGWPAVYGG